MQKKKVTKKGIILIIVLVISMMSMSTLNVSAAGLHGYGSAGKQTSAANFSVYVNGD